VRRVLAVGLPLLAAWLVVASALFVWPHDDEPITGRADAVVSLAGSANRLPAAQRLVADGVAPVLAVSLDGSENNRDSEQLCRRPRPRLVCFRADPISTRGEARSLGRLAQEHGWDDVVVVTSDFHVFRARMILERCYADRLRIDGVSSSPLWRPWHMATESVKLVLALTLRRRC
jgi:uncharacterized SAM-binding protein YcdF (DUF218 family)